MPQLEPEVERALTRFDYGFDVGTSSRCCGTCVLGRAIYLNASSQPRLDVQVDCGVWGIKVGWLSVCKRWFGAMSRP